MGIFSFQASKNLPAGEGGIFVTNREDLKERANRFRMFGEDVRESDKKAFDPARPLDGAREYNSLMMGWMYRRNELTAALCRSQLRRLDASLDAARGGTPLTSPSSWARSRGSPRPTSRPIAPPATTSTASGWTPGRRA